MSKLEEKRKRCELVNELIRIIADCGRRFFHSSEMGKSARSYAAEYDCMGIAPNRHIYFVSQWDGKHVYTHYKGTWRGFHHGGTMRRLVEEFRDFIQSGIPMNLGYFGPWPDWSCGGDLWGYGKDNMQTIRDAALRLGVAEVKPRKDSKSH